MRWEDERYVRLYTRDSATWALMPWQSRCLLPLLLRKVDRAGVLEVAPGEESAALAELVKIPLEVVDPGLEGLKKRGVVVVAHGKLRLPTFLAAQSAKQSDKIRQQKSRELAAMTEGVSHAVTAGHTASQDVTLSCAVPSCAVPSTTLSTSSTEKAKKPKKERPTDPRLHPLRIELERIYLEKKHTEYPFDYGYELRVLQRLLARKPATSDPALWVITLSAAWSRALDATHPDCRNLDKFEEDLPRYLAPSEKPMTALEKMQDQTKPRVHVVGELRWPGT